MRSYAGNFTLPLAGAVLSAGDTLRYSRHGYLITLSSEVPAGRIQGKIFGHFALIAIGEKISAESKAGCRNRSVQEIPLGLATLPVVQSLGQG